ncbi:P-loop containing nucleoside triphosphate hydrolase protein [Boletus edulis BED1]|uniref:P-loop containing nucleoside triphosphate hydrolase protein n=1 Tax=Boletus edulis BED1 TaxID=1328754 RepID=A0AAD4G790_BOLED|nr:P-loop containing nucleoside triphosphate hydrolase protein [Boletus edulis BED1]
MDCIFVPAVGSAYLTAWCAALLLFSKDEDGLPWNSPRWQKLTGVFGLPWETDPGASDDAPAKNVPSWNVRVANAVKVFTQAAWSLPSKEQDEYITTRVIDNNALGRSAWTTWIQKESKNWKINTIIDQVLVTQNASPTAVLSAMRVQQLPSAEDAQIYLAQNNLAVELFGEEAFIESSDYLKPVVGNFCRTLLSHTWNRYRKLNHRELNKMQKGIANVGDKWKFMVENPKNVTAKEIKLFLRELRHLLLLLSRYNDDDSKKLVSGYVADLEAMLATLMKDASIGDPWKIPKPIQDALRALASREDVEAIAGQIKVSLENVQMSANPEPLELELDDNVDLKGWKEGVEELSKVSEESLWTMLGFPEKKLPFMQKWTDSGATIDPWSAEGQAWLEDERSDRLPLKPRWHQLVGIYRMLERAFEGKPVLLMDGVGLGKTLQVLGTIACLTFYRNHYSSHKKFPGQFADRKFTSPDGNVPDLPYVIVCPVNLREQWHAEIKRFLAFATFDILPYVGRFHARKTWWETLFQKSEQPKINRIILATFSAIQDDASICYDRAGKAEMGKPLESARFAKNALNTLFGHQYTLLAVDEAHAARKHNVAHTAVRALKEKAKVLVAMTATPVTTRPQDLYIMGQWMGIPGFDNFDEFSDMSRQINRASRADSKALRDAGAEGSIIRGMLSGARNKEAPSLELPGLVHEVMQKMRERFAANVIRRTIDSIDYKNEKLFGMKPYLEHVMEVRMYEWEMEMLRDIAKVLVQENPIASIDTRKNFYIEFRRSILHPTSNPKTDMDFPTIDSIEAWGNHRQKTVKLDVLGKIVKYHLEKDGRPPLTMCEDGQNVIPNKTGLADDTEYAECDRIVIFSAFPSSNRMITSILKLHNVSAAEMHGAMSIKQRQAALNSFRKSTRNHGDRVLILSAVGLVGLNLACANIMIMVDTTWSAMDDEQLKGRIFRYPQQKQVHFYRLIALNTPDVFLNNIAFGKARMMLTSCRATV